MRAVVVDPEDRILLVHWINEEHGADVWLTPGGGVDPGEDPEEGLRRELREEAGLESFDRGPTIWTRTHVFRWTRRTVEQRETFVFVRAPAFEPRPSAQALEEEGVTNVRWWTLDEIDASAATFAPRRLGALVRDLLEHGPPPEPVDVGV